MNPPTPTDASRRAALTREIAGIVAGSLPLSELWPACAPALVELAGAEGVTVSIRDGDRNVVAFATVPHSSRPPAGAGLVIPIEWSGRMLGVLEFGGAGVPDPECRALLESCALQIAGRLDRELAGSNRDALERLAFVDALTGIANRRAFDEAFAREWATGARDGRTIGLLMIDVDYFKLYNDAYGHVAGDECLRRVAAAIAAGMVRAGDLAARYGGEEFVVLVPSTSVTGVLTIAENLCGAVGALEIAHGGSSLGRVTCSIGVATCVPSSTADAAVLLRAADDALYRAKHAGRNRIAAGDFIGAAQPAYPARAPSRDHLPLQFATVFGRQAETAEVRALLERHRLVTLIGIGGAGKTLLASAVARQLADRFEHGAHLLDLTLLRDEEDVVRALASLLAIRLSPKDGIEELAALLADRSMLLVLDNCERIVKVAGAAATQLLRRCPSLRILATSREPLGVAGESAYAVPLLAVPPLGVSAERAIAYDSVALYVERATAAHRDFLLNDANVASVVAACRALDGIPLAIELAAAYAGTKPVDDIVRTVDARQRTMSATMDWSYALLSRAEKRAFRRLGVFAGSFTAEQAIELCAKGGDSAGAFDTLVGLVRKSLVANDEAGRYRLLETLRTYARAKLVKSGRYQAVAERHCRIFAKAANIAREAWGTGMMDVVFAKLQPDSENLRAALIWAFDEAHDVSAGARMTGDLANVWGQLVPAELLERARRAVALRPKEGGAWLSIAVAVGALGLPSREQLGAAERARKVFVRAGDRAGELEANLRIATALTGMERYDEAQQELDRTLALARQGEHPSFERRVLGISLKVSHLRGAWETTRALTASLLEQARRERRVSDVVEMLLVLAEAQFACGAVEAAIESAREASESNIGAHRQAQILTNWCAYLVALGPARIDEARARGAEAIRLSIDNAVDLGIVLGVQHIACAIAMQGDLGRAAKLVGFVNAGLRAHEYAPGYTERYTHDRLTAALRAALTEEQIEALAREGANLRAEEAAREALR